MHNENEKQFCEQCDDFCACSIPFLDNMPDEQRHIIQEKTIKKELKKKSTLFHEGDPVDGIYIIKHGRVKLTRFDLDGNEQIVGIFSDNETIWEDLLIDGSVFPYSAECLTQTSVCIISRKEVLKVLRDPTISIEMLAMLSQKLHDANERNLILSTKDPKNRLAYFLLYREKRDHEESMQLKLEDIAASLSMRPETASRKLNELIKEGLIERIGKSCIKIIDYEGLESLIP
ncbi:MAG: Crp/Fnr family transcriptional regulator [Ruminococcus bromii]|nr:Crp/Fnr family transcriptional regulator [Ruminococcus bromii]